MRSVAVDSVVLSERQDLTEAVFELLQDQWPIHAETRRRSLSPSPNEERVLLLTSTCDTGLDHGVVAHAQLKWPQPHVCLVVSVVVHRAHRRQHVGETLMAAVDARIRASNRTNGPVTTYVWTADQEAFFERVGYRTCAPFDGRHRAVARLDQVQQHNLSSLLQRRSAADDNSRLDVTWLSKTLV
ncbi:hypothetical protein SDRG_00448 [Saprolegnia diclina VS20]|uniref:N-acetyltransferase domain-containing protein n=1 Tax=Saprolegnia diclina (strain VS20) TaxID=1156394 RepID=T0QWV6_SAPDV|nr:hypothetical protein SDRG_00448 [Saprolegnia diclina VS20]EQC42724.1 hypothetical protein SDRG_00448 [Saprolegnia diclina VS20]|eukprot:XP_008604147.1 hypothetical protein SDRG_00448 [Saprolegnia diclina VS20]